MKQYSEEDIQFRKTKFKTKYFIPVDDLDKSDYPFFTVDIRIIKLKKLGAKRAVFGTNFPLEGYYVDVIKENEIEDFQRLERSFGNLKKKMESLMGQIKNVSGESLGVN